MHCSYILFCTCCFVILCHLTVYSFVVINIHLQQELIKTQIPEPSPEFPNGKSVHFKQMLFLFFLDFENYWSATSFSEKELCFKV